MASSLLYAGSGQVAWSSLVFISLMCLSVLAIGAAFAAPIPSWKRFQRNRRIRRIARTLIVSAPVTLQETAAGYPPNYQFDFIEALNMSVGVTAYNEELARQDKNLLAAVERAVGVTEGKLGR